METLMKILDNGNLEITIPVVLRYKAGRKRILGPEPTDVTESLRQALVRGFRWQQFIDEGKFANIKELSDTIGKDPSQIARAIRLTRLSPNIIHRILVGDLPSGLSIARLRQLLPVRWWEQEAMLLPNEK